MDGVDIYPHFTASKVRKAAPEGINREAFIRDGPVSCRKDVIVHAACKKGCLNGHIFGTEINSKVPLEAVFRLKVLVSNLKAKSALVLSV